MPLPGRRPSAWTGVARLRFLVIMTSAKPSSHKTTYLNDVFVIGAGASVPYGFPTGANLLGALRQEKFNPREGGEVNHELLDIFHSLFKDSSTNGLLRHPATQRQHWSGSRQANLCSEWSRKVRGSVILTIDQFLKNLNNDFLREFGKRLMARQILYTEARTSEEPPLTLGPTSPRSMHSIDWIQQFLTRIDLLENWDEYLTKTAFLTFNYDRVLEFFLERYLVVDKNMPREEARSFIQGMAIHHMNGYLGPLSEIPFGNRVNNIPDFDPLFDSASQNTPAIDWSAVAERMRTVWEDPEHHPDAAETQDKAKVATSLAKRIFVIGTSFIPENLESIGLLPISGSTKPWGNAHLLATTKGLSEAQKERAAALLHVRTKDFFDMNALDFVVDFVVL